MFRKFFNGNQNLDQLKVAVTNKRDVEELASACGNQLKQVITDFAKGKGNPQRILDKILELSSFLEDKIEEYEPGAKRITNPHFAYYLTQVSRYNSMTNQVEGLTDTRKSDFAINTINIVQSNPLTPVPSQFLSQQGGIKINVNIHKDKDVFNPVNTYNPEQTGYKAPQYYYRKKTTEVGQLHQDQKKYLADNKAIFKATQASNVSHAGKKVLKKLVPRGQGRDDYFKPSDLELHKKELQLFENLQNKVRQGKSLTYKEQQFIENGTYYKVQSGIKFSKQDIDNNNINIIDRDEQAPAPNIQMTHVGHANEIISINGTVPLQLAIDPVNYQSYTDTAVGKIATNLFYPRQTAAAYRTDEEPGFNVVVISHNHHDHMCRQSLEELAKSNPNTIYIVPVGDRKHMERFGINNIVEFSSWDDYAEIKLTDSNGNKSLYKIAAIPANHASNRSLDDFYESLYMGFIINEVGSKDAVLCTGDTAVWDQVHFDNLQDYLINNHLKLSLTAIAHGPDRPRSHMEITHQSTADAVAMFARFQCMNMNTKIAQEPQPPTLNLLRENSCYGVGYHQGCYRLGLLSLSDVDSTLLRMLSVLESLRDCQSVNHLFEADGKVSLSLKNNLHYALLDDFEKTGLVDMLRTYSNLEFDITPAEIKTLLCDFLTVPQPGACTDLSLEKPHPGLIYDYQRLILNRNPEFSGPHDNKKAYETFAVLNPDLYQNKHFNDDADALKTLITNAFNQYTRHKNNAVSKAMSAFVDSLVHVTTCAKIKENLAGFYSTHLPSQNEGIRDEGDHHTLMVIIAGLIDDVGDFREQFAAVHDKGYKMLSNLSFLADKLKRDEHSKREELDNNNQINDDDFTLL